MDDLVVGAIAYYCWEKIEPWVVSLERCGYTGKKVVITHCLAPEVIERLVEHGFYIKSVAHHSRMINVDRFLFLWQLLHEIEARYVISTDTKDLVFQTNPSSWLENNLSPHRLVVGSECIAYKDEPWNLQNMRSSYGEDVRNWMKDKTVYNSGNIAGEANAIRDLCLNIYLMGYHNIIPFTTDQSALNVLINLSPWKEFTRLTSMVDGWVCHVANVADPAKLTTVRPFLQEPEPVMAANGLVYPVGSNTPFCILHQYDRNPDWRPAIASRYSEQLA
jgi:hypothetical protein